MFQLLYKAQEKLSKSAHSFRYKYDVAEQRTIDHEISEKAKRFPFYLLHQIDSPIFYSQFVSHGTRQIDQNSHQQNIQDHYTTG